MNITLPADLEAWIEREARSNAYPDASAYVADLIQHERERQQALAEIQELVTAGIESGPPVPHNPQEFLARMRAKHAGQG